MEASLENLLVTRPFRIFRFSPGSKDLKGGEVGPKCLSFNTSLMLGSLCFGGPGVMCRVCVVCKECVLTSQSFPRDSTVWERLVAPGKQYVESLLCRTGAP